MRRDIKKQFWFNEKEAGALEEKANATCLTEAALVRLLVTGFIPVSKDNAKIYSLTKELSAIGNNINQIAKKVNSENCINQAQLDEILHLLGEIYREVKN